MAGRDGTVIMFVRAPLELRMLIERYQSDRKLPSLNRAIVELMETHPGIARIVTEVYAEASQ
jgi:hypothetical protein